MVDPESNIADFPQRKGGGVWSDGETMFVTDNGANKVRAFQLNTRPNNLDGANSYPRGICGDSDTYWVANNDSDLGADNKIYAYNRSDGSRDSSKDFDTLSAAGNVHLGGTWCDGQTMYVVDWSDLKIFAYKMVDDPATPNINEFAPTRLRQGHHPVLEE